MGTLVQPFQPNLIEDLFWVMKTPALLNPKSPRFDGLLIDNQWCQTMMAEVTPWMNQLQLDPNTLTQDLKQVHYPKRLGSYFEVLLTYWLKHHPKVQRVWTNLPVRENGITLGEFDILLMESEIFYHWEVAVKFYLFFPSNDPSLSNFYGPKGIDRLDLKLDKLFNHQLKLSDRPESQSVLAQLGISTVIKKAFIKGILFYPLSDSLKEVTFPKELASDHAKGWWCFLHELPIYLKNNSSRWAILHKINWLSEVRCPLDSELMEAKELYSKCELLFTQSHSAILVAEFQLEDGTWKEQSRGFIAPNGWPDFTSFSR